MKILVVSDLHLEFRHDAGRQLIERLSAGADTVVVAGDLALDTGIQSATRMLCDKFKYVVYVLGNHEYYGSNKERVEDFVEQAENSSHNLHVLQNRVVTLDGVRFVGTTLWFEYHGRGHGEYLLADFDRIDGIRDWVGQANQEAIAFLRASIEPGGVVVTHHAPSEKSLAPRFLDSQINRFFICPQDDLMVDKRPRLWIHGHCLDRDTEILAERGWLRYNEVQEGDVVYSYNPLKDEVERDVVRQVVRRNNYCGEVYEYRSKGIDVAVTADHTMVGFNSNGSSFVEEPATSFFQRGTVQFVKSGMLTTPGVGLPPRMLELYTAIAADGSLCNADLVRFRLWKKRKIRYLQSLLRFLGVPFHVKKYKQGAGVSVNFTLPHELLGLNVKGLDRRLLRCSPEDCDEMLAAYRVTDGGKNGTQTVIYTSKKKEKDLLQQIFTLNGFASSCSTRRHGFGRKESHTIYVERKQLHVVQRCYNKASLTVRRARNEMFWCISVRNRNFFMRRHGKIVLIGNTHDSFDYQFRETRVLCNPYGYYAVDENREFRPDLIVEV